MKVLRQFIEGAWLLAHYFRVEPRLATRAFIITPLLRVTVCRFIGHDLGDGPFRLLGLCDRCYADMGHRA